MKTNINPRYIGNSKDAKIIHLNRDNFKINYITNRETQSKSYNITNIQDGNVVSYIPFEITKDVAGVYIKRNAPSDFSTVSFTAYIDANYSSITYTGMVTVKCLLKYFPYGLDIITNEHMSGDKVYIKIYNSSSSSSYKEIGLNPEIVTLHPGNVMMVNGVRYFDTNIAIFFEVYAG
jgi:hypothetical protein